MKVGVVGARDFKDPKIVCEFVRRAIRAGHQIVTGDCPTGVDLFARETAKEEGQTPEVLEADWGKWGQIAGPLRNTEVVKSSDALVAFFGPGKNKGTRDAYRKAKAARLVTRKVVSDRNTLTSECEACEGAGSIACDGVGCYCAPCPYCGGF